MGDCICTMCALVQGCPVSNSVGGHIKVRGCNYFRPKTQEAKVPRISKDKSYLGIAEAVSHRSTCLRRQYGAVIVANDEIIATGYNGAPRGEPNCCDTGICHRAGAKHNDGNYGECPAVHAEQNAMLSAARKDMIGATLYLWGGENGKPINAKPCPICERLIKNAGIARVVGNEEEE